MRVDYEDADVKIDYNFLIVALFSTWVVCVKQTARSVSCSDHTDVTYRVFLLSILWYYFSRLELSNFHKQNTYLTDNMSKNVVGYLNQ